MSWCCSCSSCSSIMKIFLVPINSAHWMRKSHKVLLEKIYWFSSYEPKTLGGGLRGPPPRGNRVKGGQNRNGIMHNVCSVVRTSSKDFKMLFVALPTLQRWKNYPAKKLATMTKSTTINIFFNTCSATPAGYAGLFAPKTHF